MFGLSLSERPLRARMISIYNLVEEILAALNDFHKKIVIVSPFDLKGTYLSHDNIYTYTACIS